MGKKKKRNPGNMQRPYRRTEQPKSVKGYSQVVGRGGTVFNVYPWQKALWMGDTKVIGVDPAVNNITPDPFKSTLTINGDIMDSENLKIDLDKSTMTLNISKKRLSPTISKEDLNNLVASWDKNYKGSATLFMDQAYGIQNAFIGKIPDGFNNQEFNEQIVKGISLSMGLGPKIINPNEINGRTHWSNPFFQKTSLLDESKIDKPEVGYIENDNDWFAFNHKGKRLTEKWEQYSEIKIADEYQNSRRIYDPNGPIWLDNQNHSTLEDIGQSMHLHQDVLESIGDIDKLDDIQEILKKVRHFLFLGENHVFAKVSVRDYPTMELFQDYNQMTRMLELAREDSNIDQATIEQMEVDVDNIISMYNLKHLKKHEIMFGIAFAARNILTVERIGDANTTPSDWNMVTIMDYDFLTYNRRFQERKSDAFEDDIDYAIENPYEFFSLHINDQLFLMTNIINGVAGHSKVDLVFLNYKEWILDFVRYLREVRLHGKYPDTYTDTILYPLPMRIMFTFKYNPPHWTRDSGFHILKNVMPLEIISKNLSGRPEFQREFVDLLWRDIASLTNMRQMPFRDEIATQLWDYTYYISILEPQWNKDNYPNPSKSDLSFSDRKRFVDLVLSAFARMIISGNRQYGSNLGLARKEREGDLDRLGWYMGFLEKGEG